MRNTALPLALAATIGLGLLIASAPSGTTAVDAAKKPAPTATATITPTSTPTPTPTNTPTPTPVPFTVAAWVSPSSMPYNAYPTLYGQTLPGASCWAQVYYNNGYAPKSFSGGTQTVGPSGVVSWGWHEETTSNGGTGTVICTYGGQRLSASATFTVY